VKSLLLGKLLDLGFTIFLVYWPNALQFIIVDSAMPVSTRFQPQLTSDQSGEYFHTAQMRVATLPGYSLGEDLHARSIAGIGPRGMDYTIGSGY
jgi:hypothetical protein